MNSMGTSRRPRDYVRTLPTGPVLAAAVQRGVLLGSGKGPRVKSGRIGAGVLRAHLTDPFPRPKPATADEGRPNDTRKKVDIDREGS